MIFRQKVLASLCISTLAVLAVMASMQIGLCQKTPPGAPHKPAIDVIQGPQSQLLSDGKVSLDIPEGYSFLDKKNAIQVLTDAKEPVDPNILGIVTDSQSDVEWAAEISYDNVGYLGDSDANDVLKDPDNLLEVMRKNTRDAYAAMPPGSSTPPTLVGWYRQPVYNKANHTLEWATRVSDKDSPDEIVNLNVVILGRHGLLQCNVVGPIKSMAFIDTRLTQLKTAIKFVPGEDYGSWKESDGRSGLSMAGLITGGAAAAAVAAKTGLLAKLGSYLFAILLAIKKLIILIIAAIGGGWRWLKSKLSRKQPDSPDGPELAAAAVVEPTIPDA